MIFLARLSELAAPVSADGAITTLAVTQAALAGFDRSTLPRVTDSLFLARGLLGNESHSPTLPAAERGFCVAVGEHLESMLRENSWLDIVLHGDPWIGGNLIQTTLGPKLVDFEAACTGPAEWDLSSLGDIANDAEGVDRDLLGTCRLLRSFTVAAWCWTQPDRAPEVAKAADWHLRALHNSFD